MSRPPRRRAERPRAAAALEDVPVTQVRWRPCFRIVPSRFPPIDLFERVADPADLEAVIAVESLTNERLRDEIGEIMRVPSADRVSGAGSSYIMAPFTHVNPSGGRFSDGDHGAYYAAHDRATAVAETAYHRARFLAATSEPPMTLDMRVLEAVLDAPLHDVRALARAHPELYARDDYVASQALARRLRDAGSWGIAYRSVRRAGGECAAVFRPTALARCRQAGHLAYEWDGARIAQIYEKRLLDI